MTIQQKHKEFAVFAALFSSIAIIGSVTMHSDYIAQVSSIDATPVADTTETIAFDVSEELHAASPFSDIQGDTLVGEAAISLFNLGIVGGYSDNTFRADNAVNRAEAAKFFMLARGSALVSHGNNGRFWDVKEHAWYTPYVITAAQQGIITGYHDGSFRPARGIARAEFLAMATRAFDLKRNQSYSYIDVQNQWYTEYAGIAEQYDLFPNEPPELLRPERQMSRGEVAVALHRLLQDQQASADTTNDDLEDGTIVVPQPDDTNQSSSSASNSSNNQQPSQGSDNSFPICGNGILQTNEHCDDGNNTDGDGCTNSCFVEMGYSCVNTNPSVCTNSHQHTSSSSSQHSQSSSDDTAMNHDQHSSHGSDDTGSNDNHSDHDSHNQHSSSDDKNHDHDNQSTSEPGNQGTPHDNHNNDHDSTAHSIVCPDATLEHVFIMHRGGHHGECMPMVDNHPTHTAQQSGVWSDPSVWDAGVPGANSIVRIPVGIEVQYDLQSDTSVKALGIHGTFVIKRDVDTRFTVGTILVHPTGTYQMTPDTGRTAEVVFRGNIDANADPRQFTVGLITAGGRVIIAGPRTRDAYAILDDSIHFRLNAGQSSFTVPNLSAKNWQVGDTLLFPDTENHNAPWSKGLVSDNHWSSELKAKRDRGELDYHSQQERKVITAISGDTVTLDSPLQHTHWRYVANITREVIFRSNLSSPELDRGHLLFGGDTDVRVANAYLGKMGRTTQWRLDDTVYDETTGQVTHIGKNQRARYPLHVHHLNTSFVFEGNVVDTSPRWGIVNHDSDGIIRNSVVIGANGAGIVGEDGPETGIVEGNIVIGNGKGVTDRGRFDQERHGLPTDDTGFEGDGFWFHGPHLEVRDNVVTGFIRHLPYYYHVITGKKQASSHPIKAFEQNIADARQYILKGQFVLWNSHSFKDNVLKDSLFVHRGYNTAINAIYSQNLVLDGVKVIGVGQVPREKAYGVFSGINALHRLEVRNSHIEGFQRGINAARFNTKVFNNYLKNVKSILDNPKVPDGYIWEESGNTVEKL